MPKFSVIQEAKAIAEQTWCMEMRLQGMTERQIHAAFPLHFGYSVALVTVHRRLVAERKERVALRDETRDELVQRELDLMDRRLLNLERIATGRHEVDLGDGQIVAVAHKPEQIIAAENTILRLSAERRKLLGLDAPTEAKLEVTTIDPTDLELSKLVEKMKAADSKAGKKKRKKGKVKLP